MNERRKTRNIFYKNTGVGSDFPITVQSMTNTKTDNVRETVSQIHRLEKAGCEIIRVAVPDKKAALSISDIKKEISIPLIADIHFNHELALMSIEQGVDGLRINPGNIGDKKKISAVVKKAKKQDIPIRIGVNSGSIEKDLLKKYVKPTAEGMVESALKHVKILEELDFKDIIISMKSTDVLMTLKAHQLLNQEVDYPFHIGITEAGSGKEGIIKSSVGLALLLNNGFGDTLRVSLTGDPVEEVYTAFEILRNLKLRNRGINIISCPTCGRTEVDLARITNEIKKRIKDYHKYFEDGLTVAVMGCEVNGPGEAREADLGLACGKKSGLMFKKGEVIKKVKEEDMIETLLEEIKKMRSE
ncbi:MAG TPA: flavodoxin-dependent (E)-4-hydroxy-3-methylbut-2-enyl-diphosphate synthase [Halanaerobiales bacterium]|nr:flavodoxin-dependent (E)-4-hydroxy-3-methylbut-2-enyl-diphosphate synthase [Halanaerobiales bacterium]